MHFKRLTVNIFTVILFFVVQTIAVIPAFLYRDVDMKPATRLEITLLWMAITSFIAIFILWYMNSNIKNPTDLEKKKKDAWQYVILWGIAGIFLALFSQMISGYINTYILNQPIKSGNTERLMSVARQSNIIIFYIAFAGPILEELLFRKFIFGEIYNMIKQPKWLSFIVAVLISSFIFSLAHQDPAHTLIYVVMSAVFSGLYVLTKRIIVPIIAHMGMNGLVVYTQVFLGDKVKDLQEQAEHAQIIFRFVTHTIFNLF